MDRELAIRKIKETFESPFDRGRFIDFIKSFFNHIEIESKHPYSGNLIPDAFKGYISTLQRIAKYEDLDEKKIDILIVHLKKKTSLEKARSMQRNFISWYLNGSRGGILKDAALVAFVSPGLEDWRFSLVRMDYGIDVSEKKVRVKQEFTPARRFSFLVGENERSHTAQSQFLPILEDDDYNPTIAQIEDAFSVEKVTKEFFGKYKELFEMVVAELNRNHAFKNEAVKNNINTENFTKKLLGQIIFLYFLQKKGWLGVPTGKSWGEGDRYFLRDLFNSAKTKGKNFFNDYLEVLFYDTLNNPRRNTTDPSFSKPFNCRIPFLNGGLFEPEYDWKNSFIYLEDSIFKRILDVFDLYNFTVKEDEPLEKEVAVDPEMLGKVFENLLEENLRKGKGTYYTPREIVHYMCQESLINYLSTSHSNLTEENIRIYIKHGEALSLSKDMSELKKVWKGESFTLGQWKELDELLENIKIIDPACGSGAFLIGMLKEIVRLRSFLQLTPDSELFLKSSKNSIKEIDEYHLKKETIQNCIYGVDIDPGAVEIAKLRLWLSLVVDYDLEDIEPLPNLDYKIMQGNSLLEELVLGDTSIKLFDGNSFGDDKRMKNLFEEDKQIRLFSDSDKQKKIIERLNKLHQAYFRISDLERKREKKSEIDKIERDLIQECVKREIEKLQNKSVNFEFRTRGGAKKKDAEKFAKNLFQQAQVINILEEYEKSGVKPFFLWHLYFADVFKNGGFDVVIANPPYVSAWSMEKENKNIRSEIKNALEDYSILTGHWDLYIAFVAKGHQILKNSGSLSYIMPNPILREKYAEKTRKFFLEDMQLKSILEFNDTNVFENVARRTMVLVAVKNKNNDNYQISIFGNKNQDKIDLLNKVKKESWLKQPRHIFSIKGNDQEDYLADKIENQSDKIGNFFYVNYGAQVSSKEKGKFGKKEVVGKKPKGNAKEFYEGKDLHRWYLNYRGLYLDYRIDDIYGPRTPDLFEQEKIVFRSITDKNHKIAAAIDTSKRYTDHSTVLIVPYSSLGNAILITKIKDYKILDGDLDLKYALAIILSKLESFYFKKRFATESLQGSTSHTYPSSVRGLLIKKISQKQQKPFIKIVDEILVITKSDDYLKNSKKQTNVREYEKQIDKIVYELYGLSKEEIEIIENLNSDKG